ncbi:hypothetical protein SISNIDRAFT_426531 [Sistotremastrum niveocremeum HHB9708]|uniref:N-acetyltransferase domain-containing protein n=1 Tax=Sistotremastrum niveocremeum HHB9708 TaxID=1314777 RepID=A0A164WE45_9AGAM|nr:hypothetical protein SISNIDRAFT_426531 [Sistotremastrum niveocremeum HHB9708]
MASATTGETDVSYLNDASESSPSPPRPQPLMNPDVNTSLDASTTSTETSATELASPNILVKKLSYRQINIAVNTILEAFKFDAFTRYVTGQTGIDPPPPPSTFAKLKYAFYFWYFLTRRISLQIDDAHSLIIAFPPPSLVQNGSWKDKFIDIVFGGMAMILAKFDGEVVNRRRRELEGQKAAIESWLDGRGKDMYCVHLLATDPAYQGLGYASRLLDAIARIADTEGRSTWLLSTGRHNAPFYELHGYVTVGELRLGGEDPDWMGEEVICPVMVRDARCASEIEKAE